MLVVTRKSQKTIHIGTDVVVTVLSVSDNRVRIGITAGTETKIVRGELKTDGATLPTDGHIESRAA